MGFLESNWALLGVFPALACFLTSYVRRCALRYGLPRHRFISLQSVNIGADLAVLAALTALTTLIGRERTFMATNDALDRTALLKPRTPAVQANIDNLHYRLDTLSAHQVLTAILMAVSLLVAFCAANYVSENGYSGNLPPARASVAIWREATTVNRRGVFIFFFVGLGDLGLVLGTSR